jgi:glycosyltransferase involved in cell wall biosynthesis
MITSKPVEEVTSAAWDTADAAVSVVIATHNRASYLPELLDALEHQADPPPFEVVIADDDSSDDTWPVLADLAAATPLALRALRLKGCGGPSVPRNTAVHNARGRLIAFTDDDCLPAPGWLGSIRRAAAGGQVVQGPTVPVGRRISPWDRSISVTGLSGLWESCNLAMPTSVFEAAGGFPVLELLTRGGRGFGEDSLLGATAARRVGGVWTPDAVVQHRWLRGDYAGYLDAMRRLEAMPALVDVIPELRQRCYARWFRNRRSAACVLAIGATVAAMTTRRSLPLAAAAPWLIVVARVGRERWGRPVAVRAAQEAAADLIGLRACLKGSMKSGTLLL